MFESCVFEREEMQEGEREIFLKVAIGWSGVMRRVYDFSMLCVSLLKFEILLREFEVVSK